MAYAAVCSKAVALLFLICCFVCFLLVVGGLCLSLFCCALLCVLSSDANVLKRKIELIVLQMSCYCKCSVTLRHGVLGFSVVCDCGTS